MPDAVVVRQIVPRTLDERIAFGRLLLAGFLWIPAALRKPRLIAAGIVLSAISDMADGAAARWTGARSDYSRQLDTIADTAMMLSTIGWLARTRPGALRPFRTTLAVIGIAAPILLAIEWRRHHRFGALHIHSARAAAVAGHLCVISLFHCGTSPRALRSLFQLLAGGAIIESAWVILSRHDPTDHCSYPLVKHIRLKMRS